jgi:hypothetical protein
MVNPELVEALRRVIEGTEHSEYNARVCPFCGGENGWGTYPFHRADCQGKALLVTLGGRLKGDEPVPLPSEDEEYLSGKVKEQS